MLSMIFIAAVAAGFAAGFLVCFVMFTDNSLKSMYEMKLDQYNTLRERYRWHSFATDPPDHAGTILALDDFDDYWVYNWDPDDVSFAKLITDLPLVWWMDAPELP